MFLGTHSIEWLASSPTVRCTTSAVPVLWTTLIQSIIRVTAKIPASSPASAEGAYFPEKEVSVFCNIFLLSFAQLREPFSFARLLGRNWLSKIWKSLTGYRRLRRQLDILHHTKLQCLNRSRTIPTTLICQRLFMAILECNAAVRTHLTATISPRTSYTGLSRSTSAVLTDYCGGRIGRRRCYCWGNTRCWLLA